MKAKFVIGKLLPNNSVFCTACDTNLKSLVVCSEGSLASSRLIWVIQMSNFFSNDCWQLDFTASCRECNVSALHENFRIVGLLRLAEPEPRSWESALLWPMEPLSNRSNAQ